MGLSELKADAKVSRQRILRMDFEAMDNASLAAFIKSEFANNVYPTLEAMVGAVEEEVVAELNDQGEAIDELIDQSQNILHPELTAKIIGVFETGRLIALALDKLLEDHPDVIDEVSKKRIADMTGAYQQAVEVVTEEVVDATVDLGPDDEDEDEGDEPKEADTEPGKKVQTPAPVPLQPVGDEVEEELDDEDDIPDPLDAAEGAE
ncbi:MAG: hypothetical protein IZT58_16275 [Actinobacteria bacterium]|nr:hypothetical protein [Actinomycetota bacterium]